jgi:methyl-accepting chemotaxis protein WspA
VGHWHPYFICAGTTDAQLLSPEYFLIFEIRGLVSSGIEISKTAPAKNMSHFTVRHRIIFSFAAVTLLLIVFAVFALLNLGTIEDRTMSISRNSLPGVYDAGLLHAACLESFTLDQEWLTGEPTAELKAKTEANVGKVTELMGRYGTTVFDNEIEERNAFNLLKGMYASYLSVREQAHANHEDAGKTQEAAKLSAALGEIVDENKQEADAELEAIMSGIATAERSV